MRKLATRPYFFNLYSTWEYENGRQEIKKKIVRPERTTDC